MSLACILLDGDVSKIDLVVSAPHGEPSERKFKLNKKKRTISREIGALCVKGKIMPCERGPITLVRKRDYLISCGKGLYKVIWKRF
jgi:hypothetical protein